MAAWVPRVKNKNMQNSNRPMLVPRLSHLRTPFKLCEMSKAMIARGRTAPSRIFGTRSSEGFRDGLWWGNGEDVEYLLGKN